MDELVARVARQIAPSAWLSFDARCKDLQYTPQEIQAELARTLYRHPHGAMVASLAKARAIIPIVAEWRRELDARIALSKYDPRNRNGAREWDEWAWAAGQIATAIRGAE